MIKANPDPLKSVDVTRTYTAILAGIRGASFVGLPAGHRHRGDPARFRLERLVAVHADGAGGPRLDHAGGHAGHGRHLPRRSGGVGSRTDRPHQRRRRLSISGAVKIDISASCWPPANSTSSSCPD
jgi:hypothetical protein